MNKKISIIVDINWTSEYIILVNLYMFSNKWLLKVRRIKYCNTARSNFESKKKSCIWNKSAAEAHRMLVEVYDDTAPTDKSCRE